MLYWGTLLPPLTSASMDPALLDFEQAGSALVKGSKNQRVERSQRKAPRA